MSGGTVWNSLVDSYDRRIPAPYAAMPGSETQRSRIADLTLSRFGTSGVHRSGLANGSVVRRWRKSTNMLPLWASVVDGWPRGNHHPA
jgi:hypothetical protein